MALGQGFSTDYNGLHLKVEAMQDGWYYRIVQVKDSTIRVDWTAGLGRGTSKYQEPEDIKFEALTTAMGLMDAQDDPHNVFEALRWHPYGPGH
jgi:hypothetical protein